MIAIDGKTLLRSHDHAAGKKALHVVRAWAVENRLVLAQLATEEKSNEITAIPLLLRQLALAGCSVTIDAMGTQTKIADQIIEQEGESALARHARTRGTFTKRCKPALRWLKKRPLRACHMSRIAALRKGTVGSRSGTPGPSVILRSWRISTLRRGGKACEGLGWCEPNGALTKRLPGKPATRLAQFPLGENVCLRGPKPTFALKTACIGCWMSLFVKMNHA